MRFGYDYFALASTGFGETGVFAAIGDPFNLNTGGGRFEVSVTDAPATGSVPEPASMTTFGIGVIALLICGHLRRRTGISNSSPPALNF
jgi:hypothetical protein